MNYDECQKLACDRIYNPKVGYIFNEMFTHWTVILDIINDKILVLESSCHGKHLTEDFRCAAIKLYSNEEFINSVTYNSMKMKDGSGRNTPMMICMDQHILPQTKINCIIDNFKDKIIEILNEEI